MINSNGIDERGVLNNDDLNNQQASEKEIFKHQNYYKVQKKQLLLIIISYLLFNLFNFFWEIVYLLRFPSDITCITDQEYVKLLKIKNKIRFF